MAPRSRGPQRTSKSNRDTPKSLKRKRDVEDIEALNQRVNDLELKPEKPPQEFSDLPLSQSTLSGLEASHFKKLTAIQANGIPASLKRRDVLGAAKTGSGKTLAFIIPVLENLYRRRWTELDGLGALILSPTRELAIQIFEVLRKVGRNHTFSAGLVIGGKSLREERERLGRMNILVATPGRMLQHMDQTADFDIGNLQMLVLDEADRIMDMGFKPTLDAIIDHLPMQGLQTLMFSATQTKRVSDLARLSLTDPEFVSVHETADTATPASLQQNYVITPLPEKLDTLWSFIRANVKKKILVFMSSSKQIRFVYEAFRHLQPGLTLLHLHGRQKQTARLDITTKFSNSRYACLFATDVAARGLDFPAVDWVVQVDCPEDADTYIHRVGRTARFEHDGRAILFVDPSEESGMLSSLERKRVFLEKINVRQKKMQNTVRNQLQNMCFKDPELKYLGQKAFISYVRSVHLQKDKDTFKLKELDLEGFAGSMGLPGAPKVKFMKGDKGDEVKIRKNMPRALLANLSSDEEMSEGNEMNDRDKAGKDKPTVRTKYDRMFERRNQDVLTEHYSKLIQDERETGVDDGTADADEDGDFLSVKRRFTAGDAALGQQSDSSLSSDAESDNSRPPDRARDVFTTKKAVSLGEGAKPLLIDSNRRAKLLKSKKALLRFRANPSVKTFDSEDDDDNVGHDRVYYADEKTFEKAGNADAQRQQFLRGETERVTEADLYDKETAKRKRREKREKRKEREREAARTEDGSSDGANDGVQLAPYDEDAMQGVVDAEEQELEEQKKKKGNKWFEGRTSEGENSDGNVQKKKKKQKPYNQQRAMTERQEPQTLEDLEALASGLLAR